MYHHGNHHSPLLRRARAHCRARPFGLSSPKLNPRPSSPTPTKPHRPNLNRPSPSEHRRRRAEPLSAAARCGPADFGHLFSPRSHLEIALVLLLLFPCRAPTSDKGTRRNFGRTKPSQPAMVQGLDCFDLKLLRVFSANPGT